MGFAAPSAGRENHMQVEAAAKRVQAQKQEAPMRAGERKHPFVRSQRREGFGAEPVHSRRAGGMRPDAPPERRITLLTKWLGHWC